MPTFYNFTKDGLVYSFEDVFVPADVFRSGNLWSWGKISALGIPNIGLNRTTPVTIFSGGVNWKQVSSGYKDFSLAIKTDGTLWGWGNVGSVLGINNSGIRSTPVTTFTGGTNWRQVSSGYTVAAAIKTDGTLWTWGYARFGQLGNGAYGISEVFRLTPVTTFTGGTNWKQVSCGKRTTTAIKSDGSLWAWGNNFDGQFANATFISGSTPVTTFTGGNNWKQTSTGHRHVAAIKTDGTLWLWGDGGLGKLGDTTISSFPSTPITTFAGGTNWKQVSVSSYHTSAIKTDGTLWTWGYNSFGQLGINAVGNRSTPVTTLTGGNNWKEVSSGDYHTAAVKTDGTLWIWGRNTYGQIGNFSVISASTPVTTFAGGTNWKGVSSGGYSTVAIRYDDPVL